MSLYIQTCIILYWIIRHERTNYLSSKQIPIIQAVTTNKDSYTRCICIFVICEAIHHTGQWCLIHSWRRDRASAYSLTSADTRPSLIREKCMHISMFSSPIQLCNLTFRHHSWRWFPLGYRKTYHMRYISECLLQSMCICLWKYFLFV